MADPLRDVVSGQYEAWVYPAPIEDLPAWLENHWQWFDPSHAHRLLWPDSDYRPGMQILVAGCGTNQAAVIAYTNPTAKVTAIDVSNASLQHHRDLKDRYDLQNLELHRLPIEQVASLDRDFDLIITTGVLHHLADPAAGMRALGRQLRPDGVLAVMLYANYGRAGVQIMQSVFRDLGLGQTPESLAVVRDAIAHLGPRHPLMSYLSMAPDLDDDAGLVDTFLHGREQAYTIDECRDLVESCGLAFQDVFLKSSYYAPVPSPGPFLSAIAALPREEQWSIMQRLNTTNACHFFLACRPERPRDTYLIDFREGRPLHYIPSFRTGCRLAGRVVQRHDWERELTPLQAALVERVDGRRSIEAIASAVAGSGGGAHVDPRDITSAALETFQSLWQQDFLAMGIAGGGDVHHP